MQRLTILAFLALCGCADFNRGFMASYNRVHAGDSSFYGYSAPCGPPTPPTPVYAAPMFQPIQNGMILTSGRPTTFYNFNPNTGMGSFMTPGRPTMFIYGH